MPIPDPIGALKQVTPCGNLNCWCEDDALIAKAIVYTRTSCFTKAELGRLAKLLRAKRYTAAADRIERARGGKDG